MILFLMIQLLEKHLKTGMIIQTFVKIRKAIADTLQDGFLNFLTLRFQW